MPDIPEHLLMSADGPDLLVGSIRQAVSAAGPRSGAFLPSLPGWSEAGQPGLAAQGTFYLGIDGRRQAVINLLQDILYQDEPCELMLVSEEPMDWLLDDPAFTRTWMSLMFQVIRSGHHITVIHIVNRKTQDIAQVVEYWLPLHLAGHIHSFYKPNYDDPAIQSSLFIVGGRMACHAQSSANQPGQYLTRIDDDPALVEHYTHVYAGYLSQCQPFLKAYSAHNAAALAGELENLSGQRQVTLRWHLNIDYLPARTAARLTGRLDTDLPVRPDPDAQVVDLVPDTLLEDILSQGAVIRSDCALFLDRPFRLDPAESAEWLLGVAAALRSRKNYELYFFPAGDAASLGCSVASYENQAALFAPVEASQAFTILLQERNALYSLGLYLERFISRIPTSQRSKPDVIRRLERTAELLIQQAQPPDPPSIE